MAALKTVFSGWGDLAAMQPSDWGAIAIMALVGSVLAHRVLLFPRYVTAATASHVCNVEIPGDRPCRSHER